MKNDGIKILKELLSRVGINLTEQEEEKLRQRYTQEDNKDTWLTKIYEDAMDGFFCCAAEGKTFASEQKIREKFGTSLEENYPEANKTFLNFAKTYWTFQDAVLNLYEEESDGNAVERSYSILSGVERDIAAVFFPTSGAYKINYRKREEMQRTLLKECSAKFDIDEFIKGNPILIRDKENQKGFFGKLFGN